MRLSFSSATFLQTISHLLKIFDWENISIPQWEVKRAWSITDQPFDTFAKVIRRWMPVVELINYACPDCVTNRINRKNTRWLGKDRATEAFLVNYVCSLVMKICRICLQRSCLQIELPNIFLTYCSLLCIRRLEKQHYGQASCCRKSHCEYNWWGLCAVALTVPCFVIFLVKSVPHVCTLSSTWLRPWPAVVNVISIV